MSFGTDKFGPAAPIAAAGAAAASADHPTRRAPDGEVFTTPGTHLRRPLGLG